MIKFHLNYVIIVYHDEWKRYPALNAGYSSSCPVMAKAIFLGNPQAAHCMNGYCTARSWGTPLILSRITSILYLYLKKKIEF